MMKEERHAHIISRIQKDHWLRVEELAKELGVSEMTIRRDLDALEQRHLLTRCHGGAVAIEKSVQEDSYETKSGRSLDEKKAIAKRAAVFVQPGMSIFLDEGTTVYALAEELVDIENLAVVTADLKIATLLCGTNTEIHLLGGVVHNATYSIMTLHQQIIDYKVDIAFIGARSIDQDMDIMTPTIEKAHIKKTFRSRAKTSYLLADAKKFDKRALFRIDTLADYTGVITNKAFSDAELRRFKSNDVHIIPVLSETPRKRRRRPLIVNHKLYPYQ
jgi:DeoR family fructose operon transcriptional repressor